jgi:hypothetical protein
MLKSEKQLKKLIKHSLLNEGFFDKAKNVWNKLNDPTFHHQVAQNYKNVSNKYDAQYNPDNLPIKYGSDLSLEGFLEFIFVTDQQTPKALIYVNHKYLNQHQSQEIWADDIYKLIKPKLIAYLGLTPSQTQNPIVYNRFEKLMECVTIQISSSTKYFAQGGGINDPQAGFNNLIDKIKPDLIEDFARIVPTILRPLF